jgi:hypothetical protein
MKGQIFVESLTLIFGGIIVDAADATSVPCTSIYVISPTI